MKINGTQSLLNFLRPKQDENSPPRDLQGPAQDLKHAEPSDRKEETVELQIQPFQDVTQSFINVGAGFMAAEISSSPSVVVVSEKHRCNKCGKGFGLKANLKRHESSVHSLKEAKYLAHAKQGSRFSCKICLASYTHSSKLKRHYIKKHSSTELTDAKVSNFALMSKRLPRRLDGSVQEQRALSSTQEFD